MILNALALKRLTAQARQVGASAQDPAQPVPSPCTSVCQIDAASGLCRGCLRTLDEIGLWGRADDAFKRVVWTRIEARLAHCEAA